jgi:hypothetical protein
MQSGNSYERPRQSLFIEQHNEGYAILRGSSEKRVAVEPPQGCGA